MFFHNYKYRIKCILRDKQTMFWILFFPIILAVLFQVSLGNIGSAENFEPIKIAVVKNSSYKEIDNFTKIVDEVSKKNDKDALFKTKYTKEDKAEQLLKENKIEGYIYFDKDINIKVNKTGLNQTIIKTFVDEYKTTSSTVKRIIHNNPQLINKKTLKNLLNDTNYLKEVSVSKQKLDSRTNYFYTLIAMACLYGSFLGVKEINAIQGNQSSQGARLCISPAHKLKLFSSSMAAVTTIEVFNIGLLILFMNFALGVDFSSNLPYVLLTCLIGSITGVTMGTCVGIIMKKKEGLKIGILISITMLMSFFAGMMYDKMKFIIETKMPILSYMNPVNLIADSFYSLYYYDTLTKYFINISILCVFSVIFSVITCLVLRGQKYASL